MQPVAGSLNVYKGPNSVKDYFDPDVAPPLPLVELPDSLNPYRDKGIHIYAKMMTMHPANNVKAMPAMNLLQNGYVPGRTSRIVEYSSGSTVISMGLVSRVLFNLDNVHAYLSNKTSQAKLDLMRFFGLNITLFGGPSQPEPLDERGGIFAAQRAAAENQGTLNPNQYENDDNWKAHTRWTGPQILRQLPEIDLICAGMGTAGTMTGLGTFFGDQKPSVFRLGVCTAAGDRVPGPRSLALMRPVPFPWEAAVDRVEEVRSADAYALSLRLCRGGIVCGPSSGLNLKGLYQFLDRETAAAGTGAGAGALGNLKAGEDGQIHCVTLCCDLPYQYIGEYFDKLGPEHFPAMKNASLAGVDLYRYDEVWEQDALTGLAGFYSIDRPIVKGILLYLSRLRPWERAGWQCIVAPEPGTVVIDLRKPEDYERFSLPGSINIPLAASVHERPFADPAVLSRLWCDLDTRLKSGTSDISRETKDKRSLIICYNGDSARVATSVLRFNGRISESIRGGAGALQTLAAMN